VYSIAELHRPAPCGRHVWSVACRYVARLRVGRGGYKTDCALAQLSQAREVVRIGTDEVCGGSLKVFDDMFHARKCSCLPVGDFTRTTQCGDALEEKERRPVP
jgi:hypothetical protein